VLPAEAQIQANVPFVYKQSATLQGHFHTEPTQKAVDPGEELSGPKVRLCNISKAGGVATKLIQVDCICIRCNTSMIQAFYNALQCILGKVYLRSNLSRKVDTRLKLIQAEIQRQIEGFNDRNDDAWSGSQRRALAFCCRRNFLAACSKFGCKNRDSVCCMNDDFDLGMA